MGELYPVWLWNRTLWTKIVEKVVVWTKRMWVDSRACVEQVNGRLCP